MPRLNPKSTEDDINDLIAEAESEWERTETYESKAFHVGGSKYLTKLKQRLDLKQEESTSGKKMLKSSIRAKYLKRYQEWDEAVGTEEPTPAMVGRLEELDWGNKTLTLGIEKKEWKASVMRKQQ